ncbi:sorting nexin-24 isoform X6 [Gallus gallus]|uniref:sorting nexin-24 isoform X6 n=1 Tax=Gallus gallus TaxID=9031 RepID=UPI001AE54673|nr:sorting nexin-24 isoform X6 [Gallus gallus]XP_046790923.1 sorting nexin-24 isoform X6 [Gallus gallus]
MSDHNLLVKVFKIEVLMSGRKHFVEKRYSEFHALHKKTVILENEELPKIFLDFLNVRHVPTLPKAESCGSFDETESEESSKLSHQPVLLFLRDPYVLPKANEGQLRQLFRSEVELVLPGYRSARLNVSWENRKLHIYGF